MQFWTWTFLSDVFCPSRAPAGISLLSLVKTLDTNCTSEIHWWKLKALWTFQRHPVNILGTPHGCNCGAVVWEQIWDQKVAKFDYPSCPYVVISLCYQLHLAESHV